MLVEKKKPIKLLNSRTGETWLCDDVTKVKNVDGVDFLEVYQESKNRVFLINQATFTKKML